ncbi:MAG: DUF2783 domain-containing protein [Nitrococcus mobilis]|nr:DUF2783 domain-containing protein [Nitrococcus mobilis]
MKPSRLNVEPQLAHPDDFYQALLELHQGLTDEESRLANAKLILLLANHIGDQAVLDEALRIAREGLGEGSASAVERSGSAVPSVIWAAPLRRVTKERT